MTDWMATQKCEAVQSAQQNRAVKSNKMKRSGFNIIKQWKKNQKNTHKHPVNKTTFKAIHKLVGKKNFCLVEAPATLELLSLHLSWLIGFLFVSFWFWVASFFIRRTQMIKKHISAEYLLFKGRKKERKTKQKSRKSTLHSRFQMKVKC